ncbi:hypothetical protein TcCL_NonESM09195 [Trypanosoma cruzi]|nr:hypothetical protein TcCL_NonESM09195 [Trypanosoma cruzi]
MMGEEGIIVPFCASVDAYIKKGAGIDLIMKSVAGLSRLVSLYSQNEETSRNYAKFGQAIINCRMLANHFRYAESLNFAIVKFKKGMVAHFFLGCVSSALSFSAHWNRSLAT